MHFWGIPIPQPSTFLLPVHPSTNEKCTNPGWPFEYLIGTSCFMPDLFSPFQSNQKQNFKMQQHFWTESSTDRCGPQFFVVVVVIVVARQCKAVDVPLGFFFFLLLYIYDSSDCCSWHNIHISKLRLCLTFFSESFMTAWHLYIRYISFRGGARTQPPRLEKP